MPTDTRSSSSRFGSFGSGMRANVAASSVWRTTEVEIPHGEASLRSVTTTGPRKVS
ncbi:hypothetical protein [Mesorhizobium sp. B2-1-3A]|uniref:hypothetical protein n=1 Tax=Mesorhizobium sp. B2-1-3A TaxID=2589971 RepID=UPI0015E34A9D|nr:hypothetical protein [Mesorhizobium sp. B2-1-3A]